MNMRSVKDMLSAYIIKMLDGEGVKRLQASPYKRLCIESPLSFGEGWGETKSAKLRRHLQ